MLHIPDNWNDETIASHSTYVQSRIKGCLAVPVGVDGHISSVSLRRFVKANKESLACGSVSELESLIEKVRAIGNRLSDLEKKIFVADAREIFNYKKFISKSNSGWSGYSLCKAAKYSMCPYCNQAFSFTVIRDGKSKDSFRPTLDHFFPKKKYPFLALSLYNLVPSCYTCNSNLKGEDDFFETKNLHPFGVPGEIKFQIASKNGLSITDLLGNDQIKQFLESTELKPIAPASSASEQSIKTFLLDRRFEGNMHVIHRFIQARRRLSQGRKSDIKTAITISPSENEALQFNKDNYKNEMLGKILYDLYLQFSPVRK